MLRSSARVLLAFFASCRFSAFWQRSKYSIFARNLCLSTGLGSVTKNPQKNRHLGDWVGWPSRSISQLIAGKPAGREPRSDPRINGDVEDGVGRPSRTSSQADGMCRPRLPTGRAGKPAEKSTSSQKKKKKKKKKKEEMLQFLASLAFWLRLKCSIFTRNLWLSTGLRSVTINPKKICTWATE